MPLSGNLYTYGKRENGSRTGSRKIHEILGISKTRFNNS
jgi:hypothetical protein